MLPPVRPPAPDPPVQPIHPPRTMMNLCDLSGRTAVLTGRAQGKGCIMSIGSIAGITSLGRAQSVYGMAMAAVIQMTRELSTEWAGRGVRVNCILPAQVLGANGLGPRMEADPWLRDTFLRGIP